jgi:hypothetical protein
LLNPHNGQNLQELLRLTLQPLQIFPLGNVLTIPFVLELMIGLGGERCLGFGKAEGISESGLF